MSDDAFFRSIVTMALLVPATLLPIINPLAIAPLFLMLTGGNERIATEIARRVAINCFFLLAGALVIGGFILELFGLSIPIVKVAGGLFVAATGWRLLQDNRQDDLQKSVAHSTELISRTEMARLSFVPISFPLTVGPGSIAAAITLGAKRPGTAVAWIPHALGALTGLVITVGAILLVYRYSAPVLNRLGEVGTLVLMRLAAFVLLCIGLQILWSGVSELVHIA